MEMAHKTTTALESGRDYGTLRRNSLGLPGALAMSLAFISPTIGVIFITALIGSKAGASAPFSFILGTIGIALMASSLAQFCMRITSAGTFYTFIARSLGSPLGFVMGWLLFFAYSLQSPLNTNLFGGFVSDLVQRDFGVSIPWWVFMTAIIIFVGALAWWSVHRSMQLDLAFVIAEVTVVGILLLLILFKGGAEGQLPSAFTPSLSPTGFSGLGQAFIFVVLAYFGFESSSTVAEEVRNPRRNIPIALIGSVVLTGIWFVFAMYVVVIGYGSHHMNDLANASAPLTDLATRYIGKWYSTFVDLAAISAIVAVLLAIHNANFRIMYALGRERLLPAALGKTHPHYGTPHMAILAYSVLSLVLGLFFGILWGPMGAFGNVGYFSSLGMLPIYIITNIALMTYMWKQRRQEFSWLLHGFVPALSVIVFVVALISSLYPWPAAPLSWFPLIVVLWIAAGVIWMYNLRQRDPQKLNLIGQVMFAEPELHEALAEDMISHTAPAPGR